MSASADSDTEGVENMRHNTITTKERTSTANPEEKYSIQKNTTSKPTRIAYAERLGVLLVYVVYHDVFKASPPTPARGIRTHRKG